ncbi:F-box domain, partial [Trinorchestia longiramus]
ADDAQNPLVFLPTSLLDVPNTYCTSDNTSVPDMLSYTLSQCRPTSQRQLVNLLSHITMVECGFLTTGTKIIDAVAGSNPTKLENFLPPPGWGDMVANLSYTHKSYPGFSCNLVLVSMGALKQILVSFPKQDIEISTKVSVNDYADAKAFSDTHPVLVEDLRNVSKFAQKIRNELMIPLQLAAHRILGLPSPSHLAGLPSEILLSILRRLEVRNVLNVSETCKRLHDCCRDDALWQHLYRRDLGTPPSSSGGDGPGWVVLYKERYRQKKSFNVGWQQPLPPYMPDFPTPRIYPTGPFHPTSPPFPYSPNPVGPYPIVPDPSHPFNPYRDPDSPYFGGDIPNQPPYPMNPGI